MPHRHNSAKLAEVNPNLPKGGDEFAGKGVLFRFETIGEIASALEALLSTSAASVIVHELAKKCGMSLCKKTMERTKTGEGALRNLCRLKSEENWGKMSFQDVDHKKGSGRILIIDSFETVARKRNRPSCYFFKGFLAGFLSELFGKPITVVEERCSSKGDEHCEFRFANSPIFYAEKSKQLVDNMVREAASKYSSGGR